MERHQIDFHIAEYNNVQNDIKSNYAQIYNAIFYVIVANAFIVTWASQQHDAANAPARIVAIASWIPLILIISAYLLCQALRSRNARLYRYIKKIEDRFALDELGWEKWYTSSVEKKTLGASHVVDFVFLFQAALSIYYIYFVNAS